MKTLLLFLVIFLLPLSLFAQISHDDPHISADQWEIHQGEGIACALILNVKPPKSTLILYIKNISNEERGFSYCGIDSLDIKVFYTDSQSIEHILHPADWKRGFSVGRAVALISGQIYPYRIPLTDNDVTFIVSHPIRVAFGISGPEKKYYHILTNPRHIYLPQ